MTNILIAVPYILLLVCVVAIFTLYMYTSKRTNDRARELRAYEVTLSRSAGFLDGMQTGSRITSEHSNAMQEYHHEWMKKMGFTEVHSEEDIWNSMSSGDDDEDEEPKDIPW